MKTPLLFYSITISAILFAILSLGIVSIAAKIYSSAIAFIFPLRKAVEKESWRAYILIGVIVLGSIPFAIMPIFSTNS